MPLDPPTKIGVPESRSVSGGLEQLPGGVLLGSGAGTVEAVFFGLCDHFAGTDFLALSPHGDELPATAPAGFFGTDADPLNAPAHQAVTQSAALIPRDPFICYFQFADAANEPGRLMNFRFETARTRSFRPSEVEIDGGLSESFEVASLLKVGQEVVATFQSQGDSATPGMPQIAAYN